MSARRFRNSACSVGDEQTALGDSRARATDAAVAAAVNNDGVVAATLVLLRRRLRRCDLSTLGEMLYAPPRDGVSFDAEAGDCIVVVVVVVVVAVAATCAKRLGVRHANTRIDRDFDGDGDGAGVPNRRCIFAPARAVAVVIIAAGAGVVVVVTAAVCFDIFVVVDGVAFAFTLEETSAIDASSVRFIAVRGLTFSLSPMSLPPPPPPPPLLPKPPPKLPPPPKPLRRLVVGVIFSALRGVDVTPAALTSFVAVKRASVVIISASTPSVSFSSLPSPLFRCGVIISRRRDAVGVCNFALSARACDFGCIFECVRFDFDRCVRLLADADALGVTVPIVVIIVVVVAAGVCVSIVGSGTPDDQCCSTTW
jgi:hypothetical protein